MKKLLCIILFGGFTLSLSAQNSRQLDAFTAVTAQEGIDVYLKKGSEYTAKVKAEGLDLDEVLTEVSGNTLKIHLEDNNYRNINVTVWVTYKELDELRASSSASIIVEDLVKANDFDLGASSSGSIQLQLEADDVDIDVSSSGEVEIKLKATSLDAELSSSGEINIEGSASSADINTSSAGEFDGYDFGVRTADLRSSSGSSIKITVSEEIEGRASSGASIRYKGNPKYVNADSSSGGSVRKY